MAGPLGWAVATWCFLHGIFNLWVFFGNKEIQAEVRSGTFNQSGPHGDAFDKVVKRSEEFKRARTFITRKHSVLVSLFDLARVDFAAVGQAGRGLVVDMLHFVSSRQGKTAVRHGLRKLDKNGRFVLECRNLLHLLFQSWQNRRIGIASCDFQETAL